ncbi:TIGR03620 family F420-dependent LLM class oxidoreductase [Thermasporomyces composti]|uniref:Putative F420-dependent oxidoreductase n=1 Tax=Thermasporomyces composti TaxID=696763 RepID=A0A3D9V184_THECX|nr:TIGR03620 family F420-dependent LLM class oxidoreductase [Thermasporomyces composti]REF35166.1 putative F420-dependent oxidoreductase [Thermasporomyces composti]
MAVDTRATRQRLGRVGVWLGALSGVSTAKAREAATEIESLGYGSLWIADSPVSKEPFVHASLLLAATRNLIVGTGIANVWGRDAAATNAAALTLGEAFPGRFVLGLGVSHLPSVELRGHRYERPLAKMRSYLDELARATYQAYTSDEPVPTVLAALRPKMLELARDRADGAHPYFVPPAHTARAREILGSGPLLLPEQAVVLETDPTKAREVARAHTHRYLQLPNYLNNLRTLGFGEDDLRDGGSDRLVDAIVAWGDVEQVQARVKEHLDAGADAVLIQPLPAAGGLGLPELRTLAPALLNQ